MAIIVTLSSRHQMLATAMAIVAALGVGIGHVQAETVNSETARALAATPPAPEAAAARVTGAGRSYLIVANPAGRKVRVGPWMGEDRLAVIVQNAENGG